MDTSRRKFLISGVAAPAAAIAAGKTVNLAWRTEDPPSTRRQEWIAKTFPPAPPGSMSCRMEIRDHMLYDRIVLPAGMPLPELLSFFSDAIGHHPPGSWNYKTIVDTNMHRGNCLPPPQYQLVERIVLLFDPGASPADVAAVANAYAFELRSCDKIVARAPALFLPVVGPLDQLVDRRGNRKVYRLENQVCWSLMEPIPIPSMMHFSFNMFAPQFAGNPFVDAEFIDSGATPVTRSDILTRDLTLAVCLDGVGAFAMQ